MKAITLWQPWASLIAEGVKSIETRPKRSPWSSAIGETIAVHASVRKPDAAKLGEWYCEPRYTIEKWVPAEPRIWRSATKPGDLFGSFESRPLPLGAVVATCTLRDVVPMVEWHGDLPDTPAILEVLDQNLFLWSEGAAEPGEERDVSDQRPFGVFAPGRWALLLDNVQKCIPVPCRGRQGLWTLPPSVAENLVGWAA